MNHNCLDVNHAKQIYKKNKDTILDLTLKSKYFAYILANEKKEYKDAEIQKEAMELLEIVKKTINEGTSYKVLTGL